MEKELHNIHTRILEQRINSKDKKDEVFEALEDFKELKEVLANQKIKYAGIVNFNLDTIEQALLELKAIMESNPSEALDCLKEMFELSCDGRQPEYSLYEYIRQTLENFDLTTDFLKDLAKLTNETGLNKIMKKLQEQEKVLKIVFEKKVEVMALFLSSSVEQYNNQFIRDENKLTQEEFDLLKGYFKWERKGGNE